MVLLFTTQRIYCIIGPFDARRAELLGVQNYNMWRRCLVLLSAGHALNPPLWSFIPNKPALSLSPPHPPTPPSLQLPLLPLRFSQPSAAVTCPPPVDFFYFPLSTVIHNAPIALLASTFRCGWRVFPPSLEHLLSFLQRVAAKKYTKIFTPPVCYCVPRFATT
jgi:hypothetical protein